MWAQNRATPLVVHQLNRLDTFKSGCSAWRCLRRALKSLGLRSKDIHHCQTIVCKDDRPLPRKTTDGPANPPARFAFYLPCLLACLPSCLPACLPTCLFFLFPFVAGGLILFFFMQCAARGSEGFLKVSALVLGGVSAFLRSCLLSCLAALSFCVPLWRVVSFCI